MLNIINLYLLGLTLLSALRYRGDVPPLDGGATSLYVACNIGHVDVVQLLVEALRDDMTTDACL